MSPASSSNCGNDRSDGAGVISPVSTFLALRSDVLNRVRRLAHDQSGQTLVEYALILAVVAVGLVAALTGISGALERAFGAISSALPGLVS